MGKLCAERMRALSAFLLLLLFPLFLSGQSKEEKEILSMNPSQEKVDKLSPLAYKYISSNPRKSLAFAEEMLMISNGMNYTFGQQDAHNVLGIVYLQTGEYDKALKEFMGLLELAEQEKKESLVATALNNIGNVYNRQLQPQKALEYFLKAVEIRERIGTGSICISLMNIGGIYCELGDTILAEKHFLKALKVSSSGPDTVYRPMLLSNLGIITRKKDPEKAAEYFTESIRLRRLKGDLAGLSASLLNVSALYRQTGEFEKARYALYEAKGIADKLGHTSRKMNISHALAEFYEMTGMPDSAYSYLKEYLVYKDSIFQENREKAIAELEAKYNVEKQQQQIEVLEKENQVKALRSLQQEQEIQLLGQKAEMQRILNEKRRKELDILNIKMQQEEADAQHNIQLLQKDRALQASALEKNQFILYLTLVGTAALSFMFVSIARSNRMRKKTNQLLSRTNEEISRQKTIIEEKNRNITDSIEYASTIQEAILPSQEEFSRIFPAHGIYYRPKDIVSGDFYWVAEADNIKFLAVADCTGHGVPGALMSMVGNSLLNQIVRQNKVYDTGKILDELRTGIIDALKQGSASKGKDGMDMTLIAVRSSPGGNRLSFSGANNPLWILRRESNTVEEIRGDKQPVGFSYSRPSPFTQHEVSLDSGDQVFLFTDGFADQFGGPKGKKLKKERFKELITSLDRDITSVSSGLDAFFRKWKGELEQVDDVCVVAVEFVSCA